MTFVLTVEKEAGDPLVDIPVYVFSPGGSYLGITDHTDDQGQVLFDLSDGDYKFRADYSGTQTWSDPLITQLTGSAAPVSISRIPETGDLLAIWTHNVLVKSSDSDIPGYGKRNPLTSAISKDEGETWEKFRNLEEIPDDAWAYPAVTWIDNRALVTYFNYKGGISLKLKSLPYEWFYQ